MKGLGLMLILLAGVLLGLERLRPIKRRLDRLDSFCRAMERLRGELGSRPAPMQELCRYLGEAGLGEASQFFGCLAGELDRLNTCSFRELWQNCLRRTLGEGETEEYRELENLGTILGRYELDKQLEALRACENRLWEIREPLRQNFRNPLR